LVAKLTRASSGAVKENATLPFRVKNDELELKI